MKKNKIYKKTIPLNVKKLRKNIEDYPFVEIEWLDIEGDAGWSSTKQLKMEKLPICVSKGYLVSQQKGVTRIFTDYIKTKDKDTFEDIGNTTLIPTSVIQSYQTLLQSAIETYRVKGVLHSSTIPQLDLELVHSTPDPVPVSRWDEIRSVLLT
jgi:hypothetical protein